MAKYLFFGICFLIGVIISLVFFDPCQGQELEPAQSVVEGPLLDVIGKRIEARMIAAEETAAKERQSIFGWLEKLDGNRIKDRIEDRRLIQEQHAEDVAMQGRLRDVLAEVREKLINLPAFDGETIDRSIEKRTGPIREILASLVSLVWAIAAVGTVGVLLGLAGGVLYLFKLFR